MNTQPHIKKSYIVILVLIIVGIGSLLFFLNRPAVLKISTESGADIFVATEKGGEFKKIGTGNATYKSRDYEKPVFIQATNGNKKTISGANIAKGKTSTLDLKLINTTSTTTISEGSIYNAYFEGTLVQGIVPEQFMITSFRTDRYATTRPGFSNLPYLNKIIWYDKDNFVYSSLREGIGQFKNGKDLGSDAGFASKISGVDAPDTSDKVDTTRPLVTISDISRSGSRPLALISESNLFLSDDMGTSLRSITGFKSEAGAVNEVFATDDFLFRFSGELPAAYASEKNKDLKSDKEQSIVNQYDYTGKKIRDITINDESVINVAEVNDAVYVLTPSELIRSSGSSSAEVPMYFTYLADITSYKSSGVLLADEGIWKISEDGMSMQLLNSFEDNGVGLGDSFTMLNDALVFGTTPKPNGTTSSKLLSIEF